LVWKGIALVILGLALFGVYKNLTGENPDTNQVIAILSSGVLGRVMMWLMQK